MDLSGCLEVLSSQDGNFNFNNSIKFHLNFQFNYYQ